MYDFTEEMRRSMQQKEKGRMIDCPFGLSCRLIQLWVPSWLIKCNSQVTLMLLCDCEFVNELLRRLLRVCVYGADLSLIVKCVAILRRCEISFPVLYTQLRADFSYRVQFKKKVLKNWFFSSSFGSKVANSLTCFFKLLFNVHLNFQNFRFWSQLTETVLYLIYFFCQNDNRALV